MSTVIPLTKPIPAHGEEISSLTLRDPSSEDVMDLGYPFLVQVGDSGTTGLEMRPKVVARYVSKLGQIPLSSVGKLDIPDLMKCQAAVMGFFGELEEA